MKIVGSKDRFKEAVWFNPDQVITVGGLGSIGSWLTLFMGRLVNKAYVYDFDRVEESNLGGQLYSVTDIGKYKHNAIINHCSHHSPDAEVISRGKFEEGSGVTPICFSGFDNMLARKHMFESWKQLEDRELFVDGRLTAEELWVYAVIKGREAKYEKFLFSDDEVEELPCSFKSTTHISSMIASLMVVAFTNYCSNKIHKDSAEVTFETIYRAPLNMFEAND
jgi:hypothetical protein